MRWLLINWPKAVLALAANLVVNLIIMRSEYRYEDGLNGRLKRAGQSMFLFEATFTWILIAAGILFAVGNLVIVGILLLARHLKAWQNRNDGRTRIASP
jgi:Zn-dependent membrane protease YugP